MVSVIIFGIFLGIFIIVYSVMEFRQGNYENAGTIWFIVMLAAMFGAAVCGTLTVPAAVYLKHPENYQVDTFMVNGVTTRFQINNRSYIVPC